MIDVHPQARGLRLDLPNRMARCVVDAPAGGLAGRRRSDRWRGGPFSLRLYFLIGLPTETPDDVEAVVDLVKSIRNHVVKESGTRGKIGRICLSVNCFVPKAFTPFQWFGMEEVRILKEKQKGLQRAVRRMGGVKAGFDLPKWAHVQALQARESDPCRGSGPATAAGCVR